MNPILQAAHPAGPNWSDIAGPAGGFVAIVVLLFFGGKGLYQLGVYGIDTARAFGAAVLVEWRRSNDEMRGWLSSHAAEEIAVMREIRDSLQSAAVERERHTAEIKAAIERSAKETRHDTRNSLLVLASRLEEIPGFNNSDPPPASTKEDEPDRGREHGHGTRRIG